MVQNAKDYLKGYKRANAKLWRLQDDYRKEDLRIVGGSVNYDGMPHGSMPTSKVENIAVKLSDLSAEIEAQIEIAECQKKEIEKTIEMLEDEDQKMILSALYIKESKRDPKSRFHPTKWRIVEEMTFISERNGQRIHGNALIEIQKILEKRDVER